jgi:hypothetical protein
VLFQTAKVIFKIKVSNMVLHPTRRFMCRQFFFLAQFGDEVRVLLSWKEYVTLSHQTV